MSVLTLKRLFVWAVAVLLAGNALANHPSPRTLARMAWDSRQNVAVLFGGRGAQDSATGVTHSSDETWIWTGGTWVQRFPATTPPGRAAHSMTYDADNGRVLMFGGRVEAVDRDANPTVLNDLWAWKDDNWTRIDENSAEHPPARHASAFAYDPDRDRLVLYGGNNYAADGFTLRAIYDTWEFADGQWTRIAADGPQVAKPAMVYDAANKRMLMLGVTENGANVLMYSYDTAARTWTQLTPAALPPCVNEGHFVYQQHNNRPLLFGGVCLTGTAPLDEFWEFDGTTWIKVATAKFTRGIGQAIAYDTLRDHVVVFGGTAAFDPTLSSFTTLLKGAVAHVTFTVARPSPRSLMVLEGDPARNVVWMFGGLDETSSIYNSDVWGYRDGQWWPSTVAGAPSGCETALSAFDTDRNKLVVTCAGSTTYEWDGTEWKSFASLKPLPEGRLYARMVYDQRLKKTVLFGGYFTGNFRNDTWVWNGEKWEELDDIRNSDRPPHRSMFAMWYDPLLQRTVLYGGFGRGSVNEKVTRYDDMWTFDGSKWTKLSATTPGARFGAQVGVNRATGKVLLHGGLRSEAVNETAVRQWFDNDTWEWDGAQSKWTQLHPATIPPVRENGGLTWEPATGQMVMFGGYAEGFYLSDTWVWDGVDWRPRLDRGYRRRAAR